MTAAVYVTIFCGVAGSRTRVSLSFLPPWAAFCFATSRLVTAPQPGELDPLAFWLHGVCVAIPSQDHVDRGSSEGDAQSVTGHPRVRGRIHCSALQRSLGCEFPCSLTVETLLTSFLWKGKPWNPAFVEREQDFWCVVSSIMSGFFKRRRTSSITSGNRTLPFGEDEVFSADSEARPGSSSVAFTGNRPPTRPSGRQPSITSAAGLSSSYTLPSRSYIHHAGHGSQGMRDPSVVLCLPREIARKHEESGR